MLGAAAGARGKLFHPAAAGIGKVLLVDMLFIGCMGICEATETGYLEKRIDSRWALLVLAILWNCSYARRRY